MPNEQHTNGSAEPLKHQRFKRPPTIKPKPGRASLQLQIRGEQAPPLPMKRSRILQRQSHGSEEGDGVTAEGGQSGTVASNCLYPGGEEVVLKVIVFLNIV